MSSNVGIRLIARSRRDSAPTSRSESPCLLPHRTIRLGPEDLNVNNETLNDFINYAKRVVEQDEPERAARYGGILYLALISAFESAGMIRLKWAPKLTLEVQSVDYEISLAPDPCSPSTGSDNTEASPATENRPRRKRVKRVNAMENLIQQLPAASIRRLQPAVSPHSLPDISMSSETEEQVRIKKGSGGSLSADDPFQTIVATLDSVNALEEKATKLSSTTNWAYWKLGDAYLRFCQQHQGVKAWHDRAEQHRLFELLCNTGVFKQIVTSGRARMTLQKRLLRARKFVHLVELFGKAVLDASPTVSVTVLDRIPLNHIRFAWVNRADKDRPEGGPRSGERET